ncbi:MAG: efflux RND transporter periplasmic adaptor subunit [Myxococcales bacterium FL481]|nr:MAG: efflux RND transporter periplasmic adaptor subunit [Myxococcales bacterium FL481]
MDQARSSAGDLTPSSRGQASAKGQAPEAPRSSSAHRSAEIEDVLGLSNSRRWQRLAWWAGAGALVLASTAGVLAWRNARDADDGIRWQQVELDRGPIVVKVSATGSLAPKRSVSIGAEVSGRVAEVLVDHNDTVSQGQVLARLELDTFTNNRREAQASLHAASTDVARSRASLHEAELNATQAEKLARSRIISETELVKSRTALSVAKAALRSARAQLSIAKIRVEQAEDQLEKAAMTSPIDGTVLRRAVEPGNTIAATLQAPELFVVAEDLRSMTLELAIDEADVGALAVGQSASFTVDAWPDRQFPARLTKVFYAPTTVDAVVTYTAELEVDNRELRLRPGMTATAEIVTRTHQDVLRAPNTALRFTPPPDDVGGGGFQLGRPGPRKTRASRSALWVLRDEAPVEADASLGDTDGYFTAVTSSELSAGSRVLVGFSKGEKR